ncbi:MAG: DUF47 family protein [Candidatus Omnitrophota bacterium]
MFHRFLPKEFNFFDLFDKQSGVALDAAIQFKAIISEGDLSESSVKKIKDIEHQGDEAAHDIIKQLNTSFITPFDREDIMALTKEIDDVTDMINTIVGRMTVYKLTKPSKEMMKFADIIEESIRAMVCAVKGLRDLKHSKSITDSCVEVNRLENVGDALRDECLGELFEREKDPMAVIKWKEIYQDAETVLDICEDVAHVVGSIMIKQA